MARKYGLVAIVMAVILFFMAGAITAWLTAMIQSWLGLDESKTWHTWVLSGLSSLVGFAYWFIVSRLGLKGMKKIVMG